MSLLGNLFLYLSFDFFYNSSKILISHHHYILCYLQELGHTDMHLSSIPMDPCIFAMLSIDINYSFLTGVLVAYYHYSVSKLLHSMKTILDVAFVVGIYTRFTTTSYNAYLKAMLTIWCYFKGTTCFTLLAKGRSCTNQFL